MKIGGGLNYITGPMGAGKSLYGVRLLTAAITQGQHVVTNVRLHEDWAERMAAHVSIAARLMPSVRAQMAARFRVYYHYEEDLIKATKYRVRGKGEGRALFLWDEGQNDLNNRDWKDEERGYILKWATQLRKLGYVGYLISQHTDNTDVALRRVCNFVIRMQNQKEQTRLLGFRVSPWPLFLGLWYPANMAHKGAIIPPVKIDRFFLSWHRRLYDTWGLYHGVRADEESDDLIWLDDVRGSGGPPRANARRSPQVSSSQTKQV